MSRRKKPPTADDARWAGQCSPGRRGPIRPVASRWGMIPLLALGLAIAMLGAWRYGAWVARNGDSDQAPFQKSADLTAAWIARTLNTVTFNNQCMAQMIVQASVLDGLPTAVADSLTDQQVLSQRLSHFRQRQSSPLAWTASTMEMSINQVAGEISRLSSLQTALGSTSAADIRRITFCHTPEGGPGHLWQAMKLIQQQSVAMLENLAALAPLAAMKPDHPLPQDRRLEIQWPSADECWRIGSFDDFRPWIQPLGIESPERFPRRIMRPADQPAFPASVSRRPVASPASLTESQTFLQAPMLAVSSTGRSVRGHCPIGLPAEAAVGDPPGDRNATIPEQGLQGIVLQALNDQAHDELPMSRFAWHLQAQTLSRLDSLWPLNDPSPAQPTRRPIEPDWVTSLAEARRRIKSGQPVVEMLWAVIEVRSRWPIGSERLGEAGSWGPAYPWMDQGIRLIRLPDWNEPNQWPRALDRLAEDQWRDLWSYEVLHDSALGLNPQWNAQGIAIAHRVYRMDDYFFIAADFGRCPETGHPYNVQDRRQLPGPVHWLDPGKPIGIMLRSNSSDSTAKIIRLTQVLPPESGLSSMQDLRQTMAFDGPATSCPPGTESHRQGWLIRPMSETVRDKKTGARQ